MMIKKHEELQNRLFEKGFSQEEIDKIINGIKDSEAGNVLSPEEVYAALFIKEEVAHA